MKEAERLMEDARKLTAGLQLPEEESFMKVSKMDVRLALFLTNRQSESDKKYKSIAHIAEVAWRLH